MPTTDLIAALISALDGEEPERRLEAGLAVLCARGLAAPDGPGARAAWLELQRGSRSLRLVAAVGAELPDRATQQLIGQLLGLALARAAESDETKSVRERLEMLSRASFEGIIIHVDGVPIYANQRMCELTGYELAEILAPDAMWRGVAPEDLPDAVARIRDRVEGEFLLTLVRKDGTRFRAEFCTKQGHLGERPMRVVALRDVTQRERTAALLRESEMRLRTILEATFETVVLSRDGVIIDIGGNAEHFFGRPREVLVGMRVLDLVAPEARENVARHIREHLIDTYETACLGANGEAIPVEVITRMSTLDGQPVRVAGLRDLRAARRLEQERRRLELQVERSQRLEGLGVLAGGIAHDFNNLLVGVMGSAELLLGSLTDPSEIALAETIRVAGERAAGLTRQMLTYAGRRELTTPEPVDLAALWQDLRGLLDAALSKKARLEFELAPDSVVMGERAPLMQVLMNLLTNASDALDNKSGSIHVSTRRVTEPDSRWDDALGATVGPGEWVMVSVRDSGVGMDPATQRRIFEPFFSTKPNGHGLGLGSCLGIVAAHGGAILVESAPRLGSTFSLLLPATKLRASQPPDAPSRRTPPCRVLVVDDEPLVRAHLRRLLELRGYAVDDAPNALTGLAAMARLEPDLLLLDLSMPDLDGVEVVRRLRASGVDIPVVLCSGYLEQTGVRGLEPGMVQGILQKPFSAEELLEAIERARN